jgi:rSAM/selenodomain-associated transferase 1
MIGPRRHVVIFARAPRRGRVKSRLAAAIGDGAALRFHRLTTHGLLRRLGRDRRWEVGLAMTPDRAAAGPRPWPFDLPRYGQGAGDLGRRMAQVFRRWPPGPVVIVGCDIPDIRAHHIAAAFRALGDHDAVFGPARDGGYWLMGLRRRPRLPALFRGVRWSTATALADTRAGLPPRWRVALIETLDDVDDGAAYGRLSRRGDAPRGGA